MGPPAMAPLGRPRRIRQGAPRRAPRPVPRLSQLRPGRLGPLRPHLSPGARLLDERRPLPGPVPGRVPLQSRRPVPSRLPALVRSALVNRREAPAASRPPPFLSPLALPPLNLPRDLPDSPRSTIYLKGPGSHQGPPALPLHLVNLEPCHHGARILRHQDAGTRSPSSTSTGPPGRRPRSRAHRGHGSHQGPPEGASAARRSPAALDGWTMAGSVVLVEE